MKTILSTDWLNWLLAQILPRRPHNFGPPAAPRADVRTAQPAASVPQNSARRPAPSEVAVWRLNRRLHNKERARERNPLTSANPLFSPRSEAKCVRGPSVRGGASGQDVTDDLAVNVG